MLAGTQPALFGYFTAALMATAGVALASGAQFSAIGLWRRREPIYLSYAMVSLCIAGLSFFNAMLHTAGTLPAAIHAMRMMIAAATLSFIPFVVFIREYTGGPVHKWMVPLAVLLVGAFIGIDLAKPDTLFFEQAQLGPSIRLPWGEQLTTLGGSASPWGLMFHLLTYAFFAWALWRAIRQFQSGSRLRAGLLGFCLLSQFAALLWGDIVIDMLGNRLPYLDAFAFLPYVLLMGLSLAASRVRAEQARRESEQRYRTLFDAVDEGFCILEKAAGAPGQPPEFRYLDANPAFARHTGVGAVAGMTVRQAFPATAARWLDLFDQVAASGEPRRLEDGDEGGDRVLDHYACRLDDGTQSRVALILRDVTQRKRHEQHQRLLLNELNHRVKNTLASVQSIAAQTFKASVDPEQLRRQFEGRLMALSRGHDVLTRESWSGASLTNIVQEALAPYRDPRLERMRCEGPTIWLPPRVALAFAMALHELSTNAIKYGALSNDRGEVSVSWSQESAADGNLLRLCWRESGGPPVVPPARRGFGSRLIERGLKHEIGGEVRLQFAEQGVVCTIEANLANAAPTVFA